MTICQLRHTIVCNASFNFIVVELMRCYFRLTRAQRMPTAILLLIFKLCRLNIYMYIFPIN